MAQKRLIIRLSSLGDVILASSVLSTVSATEGVDWVVAREYADVLRGHPRIQKLWEFNRKLGFGDWLRFCEQIWSEGYEEVFDLHGTIRATLLRFYFLFAQIRDRRRVRWVTASKQRFENFGFMAFKKWWPQKWLARLQVEEFAKTVGGAGSERPNLSHLLKDQSASGIPTVPFLCVMPGSNWIGKTWAPGKYLEVLKAVDVLPVILGQPRDQGSKELVGLLARAGVAHVDGIGRWNWRETAVLLAGSSFYLGSDTGLAHLAEAVGTDAVVLYGPTAPGLGFEPWRPGSWTVQSHLWCQPCGKIGKYCFRPKQKFLCLKRLEPDSVISVLRTRGVEKEARGGVS